jgi:hypothetical protein
VLRSSVATSPGAAMAPQLISHAVNKRTMRKGVSITKPARHYIAGDRRTIKRKSKIAAFGSSYKKAANNRP